MVEAYERGRAAWPGVNVARDAFAAHVRTHAGSEAHAADLFLAFACAAGDTTAIALLEQHHVRKVPQYVARMAAAPAVIDETQQRVRDYLLVASAGARPHIADYAGRGPLGAWVRMISRRVVLQMMRKDGRAIDSDSEAAARLVASDPSPEAALIRARHGSELAAALGAAIRALPAWERGLLKLSIIDGLTIDELFGIYGVHRATVARWIARLKQQIFDAAIARLCDELRLDTEGVESLCRAVRSQLDFSLGGLLEP